MLWLDVGRQLSPASARSLGFFPVCFVCLLIKNAGRSELAAAKLVFCAFLKQACPCGALGNVTQRGLCHVSEQMDRRSPTGSAQPCSIPASALLQESAHPIPVKSRHGPWERAALGTLPCFLGDVAWKGGRVEVFNCTLGLMWAKKQFA